jgi:hypothetical protein
MLGEFETMRMIIEEGQQSVTPRERLLDALECGSFVEAMREIGGVDFDIYNEDAWETIAAARKAIYGPPHPKSEKLYDGFSQQAKLVLQFSVELGFGIGDDLCDLNFERAPKSVVTDQGKKFLLVSLGNLVSALHGHQSFSSKQHARFEYWFGGDLFGHTPPEFDPNQLPTRIRNELTYINRFALAVFARLLQRLALRGIEISCVDLKTALLKDVVLVGEALRSTLCGLRGHIHPFQKIKIVSAALDVIRQNWSSIIKTN